MRNLVVAAILSFAFSKVWGIEKKSNTQSHVLPSSVSIKADTPSNESNLKMNIRASGYDSQFAKGDTFQFKLDYHLKYFVNPSIYMKLNPVARLNAGHVQSVDGADRIANRINIQNAGLYFEWMKESYLGVGILDQWDVFSPVFIDDQIAFVAVQGKQSYVTGPWTLSLFTQMAMPNTESATTDHNEKDATPTLAMAGLQSKWETSEFNTALLKANYFKFSQVPLTVSTASVIRGNTPSDSIISDTQRAFKYEYYGVDSDLSFKRRLFKNYYALGAASYTQNQGAPAGLNLAYRFGGGLGTHVLTNTQVELAGYQFRIEPDATMGAYSNIDYFFTNHVGYEIWAIWKNLKHNYRVSFIYADMKLLMENAGQSDGKIYFLKFEVLNVNI